MYIEAVNDENTIDFIRSAMSLHRIPEPPEFADRLARIIMERSPKFVGVNYNKVLSEFTLWADGEIVT
jgi:hypothetical protein